MITRRTEALEVQNERPSKQKGKRCFP
ncbi:hypothetical protein HDG32_005204 [Paraburkholderia sp. CI2]|nr:hypothetical protein [Paraburkholderia sp. Cpub6]MBB5469063.1 hypothetical protein [Paraburkholderia sp. CI2]